MFKTAINSYAYLAFPLTLDWRPIDTPEMAASIFLEPLESSATINVRRRSRTGLVWRYRWWEQGSGFPFGRTDFLAWPTRHRSSDEAIRELASQPFAGHRRRESRLQHGRRLPL
jgi:hypothetical protein